MFFHESDIPESLIREYSLSTRNGRLEFIKELAEELSAHPEDYRLFGPYWWFIKDQLKKEGIARKAWFHRSMPDSRICEQLSNMPPALVLASALSYVRMMQDDPEPLLERELEEHLWDYGDEVSMIKLVDSAVHGQPDLFAELENESREHRKFLDRPENFIARIWKEKGIDAQRANRHASAYRAFLRYRLLSEDSASKAEAWLLTGLNFQAWGKPRMALFCFHNAYQKDNQHWILAHMGEACIDCGNYPEAWTHFRELSLRMPDNPEYAQRLQWLSEKLHRRSPGPSDQLPARQEGPALWPSSELPFHRTNPESRERTG